MPVYKNKKSHIREEKTKKKKKEEAQPNEVQRPKVQGPKEKAAEYLRKQGYDAANISGVVTVFSEGDTNVVFKEVSEKLKKHGYTASFGVKAKP